ncbi:MAG TPA: lysine--tRNA ligase [Verrucomicrobiae bacterium]|jgi:lysyl-tRNA synthetase class 2
MDDTNSLIEQRKAKLAALHAKGIFPFKNKFTPAIGCGDARAKFVKGELAEHAQVSIAGRITAHREMGKSMFIDLRDQSGRIQIYAQKQSLGDDQWNIFTHLDLGDFIGATGTLFRTKTNEPSVKIESFTILSKALRPPPAKWHGLEDTEIRYRQRYLDLMANPEVKDVFLKRSEIIREIRNFLHARGFVEVETPMMQAIPGGAAAQPFKTHHNALGCDFYLRIALELYLKRLLVGGVDKVFEIGRNFRNEGLSRKHNPEFTMLEAYQAFGDYESMMKLVESMVKHVAQKVLGTLKIETKDAEGKIVKSIDLMPNWKRAKYRDLICEKVGKDWFEINRRERFERAIELGIDFEGATFADLKKRASIILHKRDSISPNEWERLIDEQQKAFSSLFALASGALPEDFEVTGAVFEKLIEPTLIQPTFVTHLPKELVPLAKISPDDPSCVEVFECCINGQEISPGYTELNDPEEQRKRLEHQAGGEQQKLDEDFLVALEHGMPPAGGMGMGIDRLCMMLLGQESIRDVILFPQLKPK